MSTHNVRDVQLVQNIREKQANSEEGNSFRRKLRKQAKRVC